MADFTNSKNGTGAVFPIGALEETWRRTEPLLSPEQLVSRHLFGIPLVSGIKDPITGKAAVMGRELLADYIDRAVATVELETGLVVFPTQFDEKHPFDRHEYQSLGYFRTLKRPVASIQALTVTTSNEQDVYSVPLDWIETGYLQLGQINIIPLTIALTNGGAAIPTASAGGSQFLAIFGQHQHWLPSFWKIRYTAGFPDGELPKVVNDLIGVVAAMEVLSMLAPTYGKSSGSSLSIDGMSQSVSTPGPEIFNVRMTDLEKKRQMLLGKLKTLYGLKIFSGNV